MLLRLSPSGSSGPREMFPLPTLDTLGRMFVFTPVSTGLPLFRPTLDYTWPVACLLASMLSVG